MKKYNIYNIISVMAVVLVLGFGLFGGNNTNQSQKLHTTLKTTPLFDRDALSAQAFLVLDDSSNGVLFEQNSQKEFEIASIVKVMTAIVAMEELQGHTIVIDRASLRDFSLRSGGIYKTL